MPKRCGILAGLAFGLAALPELLPARSGLDASDGKSGERVGSLVEPRKPLGGRGELIGPALRVAVQLFQILARQLVLRIDLQGALKVQPRVS